LDKPESKRKFVLLKNTVLNSPFSYKVMRLIDSPFWEEIQHGRLIAFAENTMVGVWRADKGFGIPSPESLSSSGFHIASGRLTAKNLLGVQQWLGPGDVVGFNRWIGRKNPSSIMVEETCELTELSETLLETMNQLHPPSALRIMHGIHKQLEELHSRLGLLHGNADDRALIRFIQVVGSKFGVSEDGYYNLQATIEEWAAYTGMSSSTFRRVVKRCSAQDVLVRKGKRFRAISVQG
jgi:CRP-like cAMP-binding protein